MSKISLAQQYSNITSLENLLEAWKEFVKGKRSRRDVQEFERDLMANLISLHEDLTAKVYRHGPYKELHIADPKPRIIHKASVRDRVLHRALYRQLYPFFDRTFISESFSCRLNKGTHKALDKFRKFSGKVSHNHTGPAWVLKCDIKKFFASIDQKILMAITESYIPDKDIVWLLSEIIGSFNSGKSGVGLPLGNLTSQLLANVYMNQLDQFIKHKLKAKYYIRYADDFVIFSDNRNWLENILPRISEFLLQKLCMTLHPHKVSIEKASSGVDYLGWVHFSDHRIIRRVTKNRMFEKIKEKGEKSETVQSYLGLLSHGNGYKISSAIEGRFSKYLK